MHELHHSRLATLDASSKESIGSIGYRIWQSWEGKWRGDMTAFGVAFVA